MCSVEYCYEIVLRRRKKKKLELIKRIDTDEELYRSYIEEPIYVNNTPPEYMNFDYTLNFLEKMIES